MSKLVWDKTGERLYETGVKQGVLYPMDANGAYPKGVPWNGLTNVTESPSGAEATALYADDIKYLNLMSNEEFGGTIEAYTYPDEFAECDGSASIATGVYIGQQARKTFGFCYRTTIGNDVESNAHGYKLHLVYGALASPSEKAYATINDNPEAITFSWEFSTTPVNVTGFKPTACLTIDSTKVDAEKLAALEKILYGDDADDAAVARLPLPDEVAQVMAAA
nr:MAG TPA: tail tube protein [Caudoviricetes sp.]